VICHLLIVVYNEKKGGWMEDGVKGAREGPV
jgi:hypothetical protein